MLLNQNRVLCHWSAIYSLCEDYPWTSWTTMRRSHELLPHTVTVVVLETRQQEWRNGM
jgi:hypothetical protein